MSIEKEDIIVAYQSCKYFLWNWFGWISLKYAFRYGKSIEQK